MDDIFAEADKLLGAKPIKGVKPSKLDGLEPGFKSKFDQLQQWADENKIGLKIREGYRSPETQDGYYAQGRTKPGNIITYAKGNQSDHQFGQAVDLDPSDGNYQRVGAKAKELGLKWGGDWHKFKDVGHIYLDDVRHGRKPQQPQSDIFGEADALLSQQPQDDIFSQADSLLDTKSNQPITPTSVTPQPIQQPVAQEPPVAQQPIPQPVPAANPGELSGDPVADNYTGTPYAPSTTKVPSNTLKTPAKGTPKTSTSLNQVGDAEDVPAEQPHGTFDPNDNVVGTAEVDPNWSDEQKVRVAANQVLSKQGVTPDQIENWITATKAKLPGDKDALVKGDRNLSTFSVGSKMLDQIKEMSGTAFKPSTPEEYAQIPQTPEESVTQKIRGLTEEEAKAENEKTTLSSDEIKSAKEFGEGLKPSTLQDPTGGAGLGFLKSVLGKGSEFLSGISRYSIPGLADSLASRITGKEGGVTQFNNALTKFGKRVEIAGSAAKNDGAIYDVGNFIGETAGDIPRIMAATTLAGGNPIIGFGLDETMRSAGRGEDFLEQAKHGAKGAIMGALFHGASKLGDIAEAGVGRHVESELVTKLAGEGTRIGTIGAGTFSTSKMEGASNEDALKQTALMLLTDLAFNSKKYGEFAQLSGKAFRVWKGGDHGDYLLTKNGDNLEVVDITGKVKDSQVQADIVDKPNETKTAEPKPPVVENTLEENKLPQVQAESKGDGEAAAETAKVKEPWQMTRKEFANAEDLDKANQEQYVKNGEVVKSSRENPSELENPKMGTWRIADSSKYDKYGDHIEQLREIPVDKIKGAEDPYSEGRGADVERYAGWTKEGKNAPPIRAAELPDGTYKISDGHRRLGAHKKAGKDTILAWVSPSAETGLKDANGSSIDTDLTHQLAVKRALAEGKSVPPEVLADYPDLAKTTYGQNNVKTSADEAKAAKEAFLKKAAEGKVEPVVEEPKAVAETPKAEEPKAETDEQRKLRIRNEIAIEQHDKSSAHDKHEENTNAAIESTPTSVARKVDSSVRGKQIAKRMLETEDEDKLAALGRQYDHMTVNEMVRQGHPIDDWLKAYPELADKYKDYKPKGVETPKSPIDTKREVVAEKRSKSKMTPDQKWQAFQKDTDGIKIATDYFDGKGDIEGLVDIAKKHGVPETLVRERTIKNAKEEKLRRETEAKREAVKAKREAANVVKLSNLPQSLSGDATAPKSVPNGPASHAQMLTNLLESPTFRDKGLGGFDVPSQRVVMKRVLAAIHDLKVRDAVIKLVPVDVVDKLIALKPSAKVSLHDVNVLQNRLAFKGENSVSLLSDTADALVRGVALHAAKGDLNLGKIVGLPKDGSTAVTARDGNTRSVEVSKTSAVAKEVASGVLRDVGVPLGSGGAAEGAGKDSHSPIIPQKAKGGDREFAGLSANKDGNNDLKMFEANKIVTADRVAEIRKELAKRQNTLNTGINPEDLKLYGELGVAYLESGARSFAKYSKAMIDDLGDAIKPHLKDLYEKARVHGFEGMDDKYPKAEFPKGKVFVHETSGDFDKFDINKATSNTGDEWYGRGQYLQGEGDIKLEHYGSKKLKYTLPDDAKILDEKDLMGYVQSKNLLPQDLKDKAATYASEKDLPEGYELGTNQSGKYFVFNPEGSAVDNVPSSSKELALKKAYNQINDIDSTYGNITPRDIFKGVGRERLVKALQDDGYDGFHVDGELVMYKPERLQPIKAEAPEPPKTPPTSIKNAKVEEERTARNEDPIESAAKKEFGTVWDNAVKKVESDPQAGEKLVTELKAKPRPLTDDENALLLHQKNTVRNEFNRLATEAQKAADSGDTIAEMAAQAKLAPISDQLNDIDKVSRAVGTENARGLNARKMMLNDDFTLASLEMRKRAANGNRPITSEERTQLQKIADDYKAKNEALENHLASIQASNIKTPSPRILEAAENIVKKLDQRADAARERLRKRGAVFTAGLDPLALKDLAEIGASHIANLGLDFAKWSDKMIEEFGDKIKPHLKTIFDKANSHIDSYDPSLKKHFQKDSVDDISQKIKDKLADGDSDISNLANRLAKHFVREGVTDREKLIDKVHDILKEADPEMTRRDAMDAISGYGNFKQLSKDEVDVKLRDLKGQMQQIGKLEDMAEGKAPQKTGLERRSVSDEERRLTKQVEEEKKKGGYSVTDPETQLKSAAASVKTRLENQIKDLEHEIATKQKIVRKKNKVTNPEIEALIKKRDEVKALHSEIFPETKQGMTDEQRLKAWKTRSSNRINELTQKIADKDYSSKPKPTALPLDSEGMRLRADLERVKQQFKRDLMRDQLAKRPLSHKFMDWAAAWSRASLLSNPDTLIKLASAATSRVAITPLENVVGGAASKIIPGIAEKAVYEGGLNVKAEGKAFVSTFTQGMKDSYKILRTGHSDLDAVFGKQYEKDRFEHITEYFGGLEHAMMKAPVKRNGFERALEKGMTAAIAKGEDVSNPIISMRIGTEAYASANRQIFMQDNRLVSSYKMFQRGLEAKGGTGPKFASTALKILFPIVKIPTNYVGEVANHIGGAPVGAIKAIKAYRKGLENLSPEEADIIMRHIKKGSIGLVGLSIGFFNPQGFGGYYQPGEKRDEKDVAAGGMRVFGVDLPRYLVHNPLFETFQIGATMRRVMDSKVKKSSEETKGFSAGAAAAAVGLAEEVPFVKGTVDLTKVLDPKQREDYLDEMATSRIVPQLSQWAAKKLDKDQDGNVIKRKPEGLVEHLKAGIPFLRNTVNSKSEVRSAEKNASTDDLSEAIKVMRSSGKDTTETEKLLRKKVQGALKSGTFSQGEADLVNEVLGTNYKARERKKR